MLKAMHKSAMETCGQKSGISLNLINSAVILEITFFLALQAVHISIHGRTPNKSFLNLKGKTKSNVINF